MGIEDWIYAKSPSNDQIAAAISSARAIDQDAKDLNTLEAKILSIKSTTDDPLKQALLTKKEAAELGFGLSESTAKALIRQTGYKEPVLFGEDINVPAESEAKLWGDLLLYQSSNLVIAPPKVGKTALMLHLAGCMLGGKSHCLGQPIHNRCDQLIILGADMLAKEWTKLLRREGLAKTNPDGSVSMPKVKLAAKGNKLDLSPMGIKSIVTMCKERPNSLLLVDCLRSYLEGDENNREFITQLERLFVALAEVNCKATIVCIHHARKSGGANAIDASSGHSSIPAAFDQTIKMSWLTAENDIQADKRILVNSTGRGSQDQSIVVELIGIAPAMWISHGDAKDLIKAEAITQALDALSDREEKQYDFVQGFYEKHGLGVSSKLFRLHFDLSQQGADRRLHKFTRRGLLFKIDGQIDPDNPKGTPFAVYVPHNAERVEEWPGPRHSSASPSAFLALGGRSDLKGAIDTPSKSVSRGFTAFDQNQEPCSSLETEFSTGSSDYPDTLQRNAHRVHHTSPQEKTGSDPLQRSAHRVHRPPFNSSSSSFIQEEETSKDHSSLAVSSSNAPALNAKDSANATEALKPQLGQAVQVFRQGEWEGGWTICDSRNPHSLRIRTERNRSVFQLANQRWGIDIRPEVPASPEKAREAVDGLNPYSKDLAKPSRALEVSATAREQEEFF
ncbi:AAA family ATPase [Synechococcus sp. UW140]|uniref:AAA family ATPase n=1 Tax=Synechococcus sp. UW140 TaxID=368503 RepID=UPI00313835BD